MWKIFNSFRNIQIQKFTKSLLMDGPKNWWKDASNGYWWKYNNFSLKQIILNITIPYMYEVFMLRDINLVFLQYYQDTIYIHNYGYISMCLWCFCCILHYCNFKFSIRKPSIALYGILFQKSHKKLHGTIFSMHLSKLRPLYWSICFSFLMFYKFYLSLSPKPQL
jgi:hypothetical protein